MKKLKPIKPLAITQKRLPIHAKKFVPDADGKVAEVDAEIVGYELTRKIIHSF